MKHRPYLAAVVLAMILLVRSAGAQLPIDQDDLLQDVGQYAPSWFAELQDVELVGGRAYVFGVGGMAVYNVSNPAFPVELGRFEPLHSPQNRFYRGAVNGNLVCGGGREDLLTILDVSDPTFPLWMAFHGTPGYSYEGLAMQGDYIFACRHSQGLEIVDISLPSAPVTASVVSGLTNSWDVALSGSHAYVADGSGGLAVIDVADPAAPFLVAAVPTSGVAVDVEVLGSVAVVCCGSAGINIFDVSNPAAPILSGSANTSGLAITAAIAGNLVHVADWDDVETFDISNPAAPVFVGGEDTPVRAMGLDAQDDLVVVADWSRLRLYQPGPTVLGDIQVTVSSLDFGIIPVGATADTTFTIGNTGGGPVSVSLIEDFSPNFSVLDPGPFTIPAGDTVEVGLRFYHASAGYDATFIKITSNDTDEGALTFPVQADDSSLQLVLGETAPDFTHRDLGGVPHTLSSYHGRVVVMAFFANW